MNIKSRTELTNLSDAKAAELMDVFAEMMCLPEPDWEGEEGERRMQELEAQVRARHAAYAAAGRIPPLPLVKKRAAEKPLAPSWWETVKERLEFLKLPVLGVQSEVFCGDASAKASEQRTVNIMELYGQAALDERLPWAGDSIVIMKVSIKEPLGMVRYRALVEKREGATARAGALRIALLAGDHAAELTLRADKRSGTFLRRFASDAPVTIALRLEPLQSLKQ